MNRGHQEQRQRNQKIDQSGQRKDSSQQASGEQKRKKESIIDLSKFLGKQVRVKFQGGREASGTLKGYDNLLNLVLEDTTEYLKEGEEVVLGDDKNRKLGVVVCRGPAVTVISPQDGHEVIENPFLGAD